jgi:hypothetical protein
LTSIKALYSTQAKLTDTPSTVTGTARVVDAGDPMVIDTEDEGVTGINPHNPDGTFHPFSRLPKKLRKRIWALNLPGGYSPSLFFFPSCFKPVR